MIKIVMSIIFILAFVACSNDSKVKVPKTTVEYIENSEYTLVQKGAYKNACIRCGMNLKKFYKTSHIAQDETTNYQYCSLHCLEDHLGDGIKLKNPQVLALDKMKFMNVYDVYYVVGSSKKGTMSRVSKFAFSTKKEAEVFQFYNGGKIMDFKAARAKAKEDFIHYKR